MKLIVENKDNTLFDMKTSMNKACGNGKLDTVKWLLENVDNTQFDMKIVMNTACRGGKMDLVKWLVENKDNKLLDMTAAMNEAFNNGKLDTVKWLLENVDVTLFDIHEALRKAIKECELKSPNDSLIVSLLTKLNPDMLDLTNLMKYLIKSGLSNSIKWLVENCNISLCDTEKVLLQVIHSRDVLYHYDLIIKTFINKIKTK